jgi:ferrochelatase
MATPSFEEVLRSLAVPNGPRDIVLVSAAPYSAREYFAAFSKVALSLSEQGLPLPTIHESSTWCDHPSIIQGWVNATMCVVDKIGSNKTSRAALVLSAHSVPLRTMQEGSIQQENTYTQLVFRTANALVERIHHPFALSIIAFQSQGMNGDSWLGPDLPTAFDRAFSASAEGIVLVPFGFPVEHLETLYDLDIEAKRTANARGLWFARAACLNTDRLLITAMSSAAKDAIRKIQQRTSP